MQILIQHVSGSKANQVDHFEADKFPEITFGRDSGSTVAYDPQRDDAVSRRHATLRRRPGDEPSFVLIDHGSTNGTRVNGRRITDEAELLPEDNVELGSGGPAFVFDLLPRPASTMARTRMVNQTAAHNPRSVHGTTASATSQRAAPPTITAGKAGVGRETVMGMLQQERQTTSRRWISLTALILALGVLGGGALYWRTSHDTHETERELADANQRTSDLLRRQNETAEQARSQADRLQQKIGLTPDEIVRGYGDATVKIDVHWRLYDQLTGKPVFQKVVDRPINRQVVSYRAYVRIPEKNLVVPWLTTEGKRGDPVMDFQGSGSGFVISKDGLILTNKHVAAGWLVHYNSWTDKWTSPSVILNIDDGRLDYYDAFAKIPPDLRSEIENWIPSKNALIFDSSSRPKQQEAKAEGRNDMLTVRFPLSRFPINARLVRESTDSDVALIKVDSPKELRPLQMADNEYPPVGSAVIVMGYPQSPVETMRISTSIQDGQAQMQVEKVPELTVTSGTVARRSSPPTPIGPTDIMAGSGGDLYQLNASAEHGSSGGPVFDSTGKVIGLLTYKTAREGTTLAVPIRYGKILAE